MQEKKPSLSKNSYESNIDYDQKNEDKYTLLVSKKRKREDDKSQENPNKEAKTESTSFPSTNDFIRSEQESWVNRVHADRNSDMGKG